MQHRAAILLLLVYAFLGSGALEFIHNAQHLAEDAHDLVHALDAGSHAPHAPVHDDSNCPVHSRLHTALLAVASVPLLICLGLFVAFLTLLSRPLSPQLVLFSVPCRGPPLR